MLRILPTQFVKERFLYAAYLKTMNDINRFLDKKIEIMDIEWFYPEVEYYIDEDDYFPPETFESKIVHLICKSIMKEELDEKFNGLIKNVEYNMGMRDFDKHISGLFYFRSLYENLDYFSHNEQLLWLTKMEEVFTPFGTNFCKQYSHFYELNFKYAFFNGDSPSYHKYYEQMRYTYVIFYSYEDAANEITPVTMRKFTDFVHRYIEFYKDLTLELEQKRQVKIA